MKIDTELIIQIGFRGISSIAFTYMLLPLTGGQVGQGFEKGPIRSSPYIKRSENAKRGWKTDSSVFTGSLLISPLLGSDLLCTVPPDPCKSHHIPAEAGECVGSLCSVDLQALQCILLQACWLFCLLLSILPTAPHSLPSPPCTLLFTIPHWSWRGDHLPLSAQLREQ